MTVQEMSNQFDILYNAIATQSAPGIDSYEKSVYLTKAQLEIIKNYYDPASNRKQKGFEASEKRRVDLKELIKSYSNSSGFDNVNKIHNTSKFFNIPQETFIIINERVKITSTDCENGKTIKVKPVTHDEFNTQIDNPFKTPNNKIAWRMDMSKINNQKVVEIISPYNVLGSLEYIVRYIKYFPGEGLTIDGLSILQNCELDEELHVEILDRAVQLALRDYKPQNLESKIQLDTRNE